MRKILSLLFILLLVTKTMAADYDAFIMNFLRVSPLQDKLSVQMALDVPEDLTFFEERLKRGNTLEFSIEAVLTQKRFLINSKEIDKYQKSYYIQYDPLTMQYMVVDNSHLIIINGNANYLLHTFVQNLQFDIHKTLPKDKQYELIITVELSQSSPKPWTEKNLFFVSKEMIQPATFHYEFEY